MTSPCEVKLPGGDHGVSPFQVLDETQVQPGMKEAHRSTGKGLEF